ncbi:RluA family pseudouridine synthase [Pseudoflavonifractor phocaeensis]|uniref:RluA family pseudouridine synthase n=1 Tax=Pseudoflavonifractor phocaeensis TaxID=1870988 RepID=UPI001FAF3F6F|nr:RluA family pseudouridine synthase [Pseudoflavonifractor phocaeensis]
MSEPKRRPPLRWTVEETDTLLSFLLSHVTGKSRNNIKSILARGQVRVEGKVVRQFDSPLAAGMVVEAVLWAEPPRPELPFPVLFEDQDIIVIDKPAGLLTIANDKEKVRTAYHILTDYMAQRTKGGRVFVVHRLDRDTSGVVLFAKNEEAKRAFQSDWDQRVRRRGYRALVEGVPDPEQGYVKSFLRETSTHLMYSGAPGRDAKEAITHYRTVCAGGGYALMDIDLETGRKNQIRVHMSDLGHPIAGDKQYKAKTNPLGRLCLHANELRLIDPRTGAERSFVSREPAPFRRLCRTGGAGKKGV